VDAGDIERGIDLCRSVALVSGGAAIAIGPAIAMALISPWRSQKPVLSRSSPPSVHTTHLINLASNAICTLIRQQNR